MKSRIAKLGLIPAWMLTRTPKCRHKYSCYENTMLSLYSIFVNSLALKFALGNIFLIGNPKKLIKNLRNVKNTKDNFRFALFAALMNAIYKIVLCLMRRLGISDKINSIVAGFLSGLVSYFEAGSRRNFLVGILMGRMLDTACTAGENAGLYKKLPHGELAIFILSNFLLQYSFAHEKEIVSRPIAKKMGEWGALTPNDEKI